MSPFEGGRCSLVASTGPATRPGVSRMLDSGLPARARRVLAWKIGRVCFARLFGRPPGRRSVRSRRRHHRDGDGHLKCRRSISCGDLGRRGDGRNDRGKTGARRVRQDQRHGDAHQAREAHHAWGEAVARRASGPAAACVPAPCSSTRVGACSQDAARPESPEMEAGEDSDEGR